MIYLFFFLLAVAFLIGVAVGKWSIKDSIESHAKTGISIVIRGKQYNVESDE